MCHPALRIAAARHFLGLSRPDELIDAAHAALDDGIYSYSLGEVATFREPIWFDLNTLFKSALRELGMSAPTWEEAIDTLAKAYLVSIAEGAEAPEATVRKIHEDYNTLFNSDGTPAGPSRGRDRTSFGPLTNLAHFYYRYEHSREYETYIAPGLGESTAIYRQERERMDAECVELAQAWCRDRWSLSLDPSWLTSTVVALARGISGEKAFARLPILADALQDAGCDHEDILAHCRGIGPHQHWCCVVDLLLGRE